MPLSDAGAVVASVGSAATSASASASSLWSSVVSSVAKSRDLLAHGWEWVKENKLKVAGGAAVTTAIGGYIVYRKVQPMLAQLRVELQMMEQLAAQMNPQSTPAHRHAILIHRLEHNLTVGDLTLRQFAAGIRKDLLMTRFDVDEIRSRLRKSNQAAPPPTDGQQQQAGGSQSEEQRLLWEEFKVAGFSRTIAAVYILATLHALVKLQVSIVSRYVLIDQQAQAQRAEAEAQAQANGGDVGVPNNPQQAAAQQQVASALQQQQQPMTFLPPALCEEVNRIYFSLSKHACTFGASQLADAIASVVRSQLADHPVTTTIGKEGLERTLAALREKMEHEVLGLEGKEQEGAPTSPSAGNPSLPVAGEVGYAIASSSSSSTGASAQTAIFTSPSVGFARFLLPPPASLSALVGSTVFPDAGQTAMASFRLAEMLAETSAVVGSAAFQETIQTSTRMAMDELARMLVQQTFPNAAMATQQIPFTNVLVASIKLFSTLLPDVSGVSPSTGGGGGVASQVASPLFHLLADLPAVKELCAVVYLPSEAITAVPTHGQLSTLEQITMNKQFAGGDAAAGRMPRPTPPTPAFIEEIKDASAAGSRPTGAQLVSAVRDVKGLPVFDRL